MRLEIFGEEDKEESVLRLALRKAHSGVELIAVDQYGNRLSQGSILSITKEGKLHRYTSVSEKLGLKLDSLERIKE